MKKLIAVLALCLAGQVWAFDSAGWLKAYNAKDYQTAFAIAKAGAEGGDARAQTISGEAYYKGQGVTRDYKQAVYWYTKAAEQGLAIAQHSLGNSYYYGEGVTKDYMQAVYWHTKAAEQGQVESQFNVGHCYAMGQGVTRNMEVAYFWFLLAAVDGDARAVANRDGAETYLTAEQRSRAQAKAAEWKPKK